LFETFSAFNDGLAAELGSWLTNHCCHWVTSKIGIGKSKTGWDIKIFAFFKI